MTAAAKTSEIDAVEQLTHEIGRYLWRHLERRSPSIFERRWWDDPTWEPVLADLPFQVAPAKDAAASTLPQGLTPEGINVAMGDASVRLVSGKVSATTFYAACTPAANDVLGADW